MMDGFDTLFEASQDGGRRNSRKKDREQDEGEDAVYTTLHTTDNDMHMDMDDINHAGPFPINDAPSTSSNESEFDSNDDDGGLLEPFPTRPRVDIDHDRRPKEADIDAEEDDMELRPGDHVYVWKSFGLLGVRTYQKHGIVLSVDPEDEANVNIVTFYHRNQRDPGTLDVQYRDEGAQEGGDDEVNDESLLNAGSSSGASTPSSSTNTNTNTNKNQKITTTVRTESLYTFASNAKGKLLKVKYNQGLAKRILRRGGTVSSCKADERGLIIARVKYLLEHPGCMPDFQMMSANGECAAVWCRIGRWCTLQGSSILHILFVGQAGGAVVGGAVASNVMFWAPMRKYLL